MLLLHWRLSSLSRFGRASHYESTAKVAASCTASKHHILLTPFPTGDISFARVKGASNLQYRAQRILEEPVVEKPDFRLFKKQNEDRRRGKTKDESRNFRFQLS
jgi:hypothetical protein